MSFYALDPLKGKGRKIGEARAAQSMWSLAPDGTRIAFVAGGGPGGAAENSTIRMMNVADGTTEELRAAELSTPWDLTWSADGKGFFVVDTPSVGRRLVRLDLEGHVSVLHQSVPNGGLGHPIPSPDGRYLAFEEATTDSNAWVLENF